MSFIRREETVKRITTILGPVMVLFSTTAAFAQQGGTTPAPGPGPRGFMFYPPPMFHGGAIILPFLILFALIGFFAVLGFVVRISTRGTRGRRSGWSQPNRGSALNILEERFARGEIDKAEFEDKWKLLSRR